MSSTRKSKYQKVRLVITTLHGKAHNGHQQEKEAAEAKAKQQEIEAAQAYADFVQAFEGDEDAAAPSTSSAQSRPSVKRSAGKGFVKAGGAGGEHSFTLSS